MTRMKPCAFCTIPEIKARAVAENNLAWAFLTNIPITPGHTLVVPKRCVSMMSMMTEEERQAVYELGEVVKGALRKSVGATGFNCAYNEGEVAGQTVPHVHVHIVPRQEGDTGIVEYEPRKFLYRPGSREATPEDELQAVAEEVRKVV